MRVRVEWLDSDAPEGERLKSRATNWPKGMPLPAKGDRIVIGDANLVVVGVKVFDPRSDLVRLTAAYGAEE